MPHKPVISVDAYLTTLDHPLKDVVVELRTLLLAVHPAIGEAVKWTAPSFRTREHFATMQLRNPGLVQLVLHLGAKKQVLPRGAIQDPTSLLKWLGEDRAVIGFDGLADLRAKAPALQAIVRQWVAHVGVSGG